MGLAERELDSMTTKKLQKHIYQNKVNKGWNVTDIEKELCLMNGEVAEFYEAYRKHLPSVGEELADIAIYLLGISEILGIDLGDEIGRKMDTNEHRKYAMNDGVNTRISD